MLIFNTELIMANAEISYTVFYNNQFKSCG